MLEYSDVSILLRTNGMTHIIEQALSAHKIPYRVIGGLKFFERAEVKDLIAYLRLIENYADRISFERIINVPPRKIGQLSVNLIIAKADYHKVNCVELIRKLVKGDFISNEAKKISSKGLEDFLFIIDTLAKIKKKVFELN